MSSPSDDQIRTRAHQLWELAGKPEGRDDEFWREAERELKDGATNNPDEKSQTFLVLPNRAFFRAQYAAFDRLVPYIQPANCLSSGVLSFKGRDDEF